MDVTSDINIGLVVEHERVVENVVPCAGPFYLVRLLVEAVNSGAYHCGEDDDEHNELQRVDKTGAGSRLAGLVGYDVLAGVQVVVRPSLIVVVIYAGQEALCRLSEILRFHVLPDVVENGLDAVVAEIFDARAACGDVVVLRVAVDEEEYAVGLDAAQLFILVVAELHNVSVGLGRADVL